MCQRPGRTSQWCVLVLRKLSTDEMGTHLNVYLPGRPRIKGECILHPERPLSTSYGLPATKDFAPCDAANCIIGYRIVVNASLPRTAILLPGPFIVTRTHAEHEKPSQKYTGANNRLASSTEGEGSRTGAIRTALPTAKKASAARPITSPRYNSRNGNHDVNRNPRGRLPLTLPAARHQVLDEGATHSTSQPASEQLADLHFFRHAQPLYVPRLTTTGAIDSEDNAM